MRNINIESLGGKPIEEREIEMVERKGMGHPDTLIDGIVENISRELCKEYIKEFGSILHHNVDKGQICGGGTSVEWGGGKFLKPIYILLSGRAISEFGKKRFPVTTIAIKAAKDYLRKSIRFLDIENDVIIDSRISPGSKDLIDVFLRGPKIPLANDTSFGVGFAPFSETERLVLETEKLLNSKEYKKKKPAVGEDVKIMALRENNKISLTIAIAFVSKFIFHLNEYVELKESVIKDIKRLAKKLTKMNVDVSINTADNYEKASVYLTLTGLSCEMGDDGSVGRGNRASGLITPCRPMSLEAVAGKNPVNHVGKIYSVLAFEIAKDIVKLYPDVGSCVVTLLSQIGKPINQPKNVSIQVLLRDKRRLAKMKSKINYLVEGWLEDITSITKMIVDGEVNIF